LDLDGVRGIGLLLADLLVELAHGSGTELGKGETLV
jgi:hypothetical protein